METFLAKRFLGFKSTINLARLTISGPDSVTFLQGQTTNCVQTLKIKDVQYNCLLNRQGRVESFFVLTRSNETEFCLWLEPQFLESTSKRLENYIVADDVALVSTGAQEYSIIGGSLNVKKYREHAELTPFLFFQEKVLLLENPVSNVFDIDLPELLPSEIKQLYLERGFFSLSSEAETQSLPMFNETMVSLIAWNHGKGCFLGQEVVQKIFTRRGAAQFPYILKAKENIKVDSSQVSLCAMKDKNLKVFGILFETHIFVMLPREFHIPGLELEISLSSKIYRTQVVALNPNSTVVDEIYHKAIELYALDSKHDEAIDLLKKLISSHDLQTQNLELLAEWHEALGAIYGKVNRFEEAMEQMQSVANILPNEVMPYTNLSLYAMKLGRIEEAEKYKEEATMKSFLKFGQEAKNKKQELEKNIAREKMFRDVLEIDEFDAMALCGLAEIALTKNEAQSALEKLQKLQAVDDKYTQSYILMGRAQESLGKIDEAKSTWQKGLSIAINKGELMPAQQIQSHLHKYSRP